MKKLVVPVLLFLALAGVIGFLATRPHSAGTSTAGSTSRLAPEAPNGDAMQANVAAPMPNSAAAGTPGSVAAGGSGVTSGAAALAAGVPQIGPHIVKTGDVTVQVKKGAFEDAFQSASLIAARFGGFVESSSAINGRSGWLQIRVPADRFEVALSELRGLGAVKGESISGKDVTSQFVDLTARLTTWRSQEAVLFRLMSKATTIGDTLRIQDQLQQVQLRIEQIQGELRVLRNQTSLATIRVALREPGVQVVRIKPAEVPSLVQAWNRAVAGFLGVVSSVMVGLGYLIPLSLLAGVGWLVWRRLSGPRVAAAS